MMPMGWFFKNPHQGKNITAILTLPVCHLVKHIEKKQAARAMFHD